MPDRTRFEMSRKTPALGVARLGITLTRPPCSTTNSRLVSPAGVASATGRVKLTPGKIDSSA